MYLNTSKDYGIKLIILSQGLSVSFFLSFFLHSVLSLSNETASCYNQLLFARVRVINCDLEIGIFKTSITGFYITDLPAGK